MSDVPQEAQQPDRKPGFYYVSVVDGRRVALALGPFVDDHAGALEQVARVRDHVRARSDRAWFYSYGTVRCDVDCGTGRLNAELEAVAG
jgi:hypothetical protein